MKQMKCKKCGSNTFTIEIRTDCEDCEYNGWRDDSSNSYKYTQPPEGTDRDQAEQEGECYMGNSFNYGCQIAVCVGCGKKEHIAMVEGE